MDKNEIEALLANMVIKKEFEKGIKYHVGRIQYKDYMDKIYNRVLSQDWNLSKQEWQICVWDICGPDFNKIRLNLMLH